MATVGWDQGLSVTLTIASAATESDVLNMGSEGRKSAYRLGVLSPAALTGVVTIEVAEAEAGPFSTLQSDAVDVNLTAGKAAVLDPVPFTYVKLVSSAPEGENRDFTVKGHLGAW